MTTPPDEPEVWIEGPDGASGDGQHPGSGGPRRQRRWGIAIAAAVVLAALIVVPALAGDDHSDDAAPDLSTTPTPMTTTSQTTGTSPSSVTMSPSPPPSGSQSPEETLLTTVADGPTVIVDLPNTPARPPVPAPTYTTLALQADQLPDSDGWRVVGFHRSGADGHGSVYWYTPATGLLQTSAVPPLTSTGPLSFLATGGAVLIRPYDHVPGYQVARFQQAQRLRGELARGGPIFPGPEQGSIWAAHETNGRITSFELVGRDGKAYPSDDETPRTIELPAALTPNGPYGFTTDGAGGILATGTGGTYLITADGVRLVTHGRVLAAGPTALLVWECDEAGACAAAVIDRASGERRTLPDFSPVVAMTQGVISPDGTVAVSVAFDGATATFVRIHLGSGHVDALPGTPASQATITNAAGNVVSFTPDGRYVLLNTNRGIVPVDAATGAVHEPLPIHSVAAFAITTDPGAATSGG